MRLKKNIMKKTSFLLLTILSINLISSPIPKPPDLGVGSYILYEPTTDTVIASFNENESVEVASLTKLMTSYVVADQIEQGYISLEDEPTISVKAWQTPGSQMFIREGTKVKVSDLVKGMVIISGNDASVALAEHIAGSEENFVYLMDQYAVNLGLNNSDFNNSSGLPDPNNVSSAFDLAKLTGLIIRDFPDHYNIYSEKEFSYSAPGEYVAPQPNRNRLLHLDNMFDGVKTGYTKAAGHCLVGSSIRDGMRLIAVVLGSGIDKRFADVRALVGYGYQYFKTREIVTPGDAIGSLTVIAGKKENVSVGVEKSVVMTLKKNSELEFQILAQEKIVAPLTSGTTAGVLKIIDQDGNIINESELIYLEDVESLGFFEYWLAIIWDWIKSLFVQPK